MKITAAEYAINEVPELDEDEFEFSTSIHPPFKDANDFGQACRSLAITENNREKYASI